MILHCLFNLKDHDT